MGSTFWKKAPKAVKARPGRGPLASRVTWISPLMDGRGTYWKFLDSVSNQRYSSKQLSGGPSRGQGAGQGAGQGRAQGTGHRAQGTGHRAQGTGHRAQGTGHRAQGTGQGKGRAGEGRAGCRDHGCGEAGRRIGSLAAWRSRLGSGFTPKPSSGEKTLLSLGMWVALALRTGV